MSDYSAIIRLRLEAKTAFDLAKSEMRQLKEEADRTDRALAKVKEQLSKKYVIDIDVNTRAEDIEAEIERVRKLIQETAIKFDFDAEEAAREADLLESRIRAVIRARADHTAAVERAAAAETQLKEVEAAAGRERLRLAQEQNALARAEAEERRRQAAEARARFREELRRAEEVRRVNTQAARKVADEWSRFEAAFQRRFEINLDTENVEEELQRVIEMLKEANRTAPMVRMEQLERDAERFADKLRYVLENKREITQEILRQREINHESMRAVDLANNYTVSGIANTRRELIKTSLASQNLIRIINDLPYGIMGMANNIQSLAFSIAYMQVQMARITGETLSWGQALRMAISSLVKGPFLITAIISAATVLAMTWDRITLAAQRFGERLGLIERRLLFVAQKYREGIEQATRDFVNALDPRVVDDVGRAVVQAINGAEAALRRLRRESEELRMSSAYELGIVRTEIDERLKEIGARARETRQEMRDLERVKRALEDQLSYNRGMEVMLKRLHDLARTSEDARLALSLLRQSVRQLAEEFELATRRIQLQNLTDPILRAQGEAALRAAEDVRAAQREFNQLVAEIDRLYRDPEEHAVQMERAILMFRQRLLAIDERRRREEQEVAAERRTTARELRGLADEIARMRILLATEEESLERQIALRRLQGEIERRQFAERARTLEELSEAVRLSIAVEEQEIEALERLHERRLRTEAFQRSEREQQIELSLSRTRHVMQLAEAQLLEDVLERQREEARARLQHAEEVYEITRRGLEERLALVERGSEDERRLLAEVAQAEAELAAARADAIRRREEIDRQEEQLLRQREERFERHTRSIAAQELALRRVLLSARNELSRPFVAVRVDRAEAEAQALERLRQRLEEIDALLREVDPADVDRIAALLAERNRTIERYDAEMVAIARAHAAAVREAYLSAVSGLSGTITNVLSTSARAAEMEFSTWRTLRERELDEMGYAEEEKTRIIQEEGRRRFERQKREQIAAAYAEGLSGMVGAVASTARLGPLGWALGAAQAAAIWRLTQANVARIRALTIGGSASGASLANVATGRFTVLDAESAAARVRSFAQFRSRQDPAAQMAEAVGRFERAAADLRVRLDLREQGRILSGGVDYLRTVAR